MKLLITGGHGYVGGRLAQVMAAAGEHTVMLGSRTQGAAPAWAPAAQAIQMQWDSQDSLLRACGGVDAVVHLAGMNARDCGADPVAALLANGVATARLVEAAIRSGVKHFLYVSTAHVYGSPLEGVVDEDSCARAVHPYATSHRAGEDSVLFANASGKIEGTAVRLSNSFGPPVHGQVDCWMLLVNDLCRQAVVERRIQLTTAGLQRRDFVTLTDACRALRHLLEMPPGKARTGIVNVGGEWAPTVLEMAERIADCCAAVRNYRPGISRPAPAAAERAATLDYRIARLRATGFLPRDAVDAEIAATLAFCA